MVLIFMLVDHCYDSQLAFTFMVLFMRLVYIKIILIIEQNLTKSPWLYGNDKMTIVIFCNRFNVSVQRLALLGSCLVDNDCYGPKSIFPTNIASFLRKLQI